MHKKIILCAMIVGFSAGVCSADQPAAPQGQPVQQPLFLNQQAKPVTPPLNQQALAQNLQILQSEQSRVVVLQDLLNREATQLQQLQEQFCKLYGLNIKKWRDGAYQYDTQSNRFYELRAGSKNKP